MVKVVKIKNAENRKYDFASDLLLCVFFYLKLDFANVRCEVMFLYSMKLFCVPQSGCLAACKAVPCSIWREIFFNQY